MVYELSVNLSGSQPLGGFLDQLFLMTNDPKLTKLPLTVFGCVQPMLEASPIQLAELKRGVKVEKDFVIRGQKPFVIREVRVDNEKISFAPSSGETTLHVLKYTLDTSEICDIDDSVEVVVSFVDNPEEYVEKSVSFSARIVAGD